MMVLARPYRGVIFLIILQFISIPYVFSSDEIIYNSDFLIIKSEISSGMKIISSGSNPMTEYLIVNHTYFPKDSEYQQVILIRFEPDPIKLDEEAVFRWDKPLENENIVFSISSEIKTLNRYKQINEKIDFPIKDLEPEFESFTRSSKNIDSDNRKIIELSNELASGENDLFLVVFNLAEWTNDNIDYNLSTMTQDVSQKASWVLENRKGVCDELTNLFIALCRSIGIPARFVSGLSYTSSELFEEPWGAHGWSEVFFPGVGWVPFDITYGEFGFVDASHIKFKESLDSSDPSTRFSWKGFDVNLETNKLEFETEIVEYGAKLDDNIALKAEMWQDEVGFGSYNIVIGEIENLKNHYLSTELALSTSDKIESFDDVKRQIVLKPREKRKERWVIKVDSSLDPQYAYTFQARIHSLKNISTDVNFRSNMHADLFSHYDVLNYLEQHKTKSKKYFQGVDVECSLNKKAFYIYESLARINCRIKNIGNAPIKDLKICLDSCESIDFSIAETRNISIDRLFNSTGAKADEISITSKDITEKLQIEYYVLDPPELMITDLTYPSEARYDDRFSIKFNLKNMSDVLAKEVRIRLKINGNEIKNTGIQGDYHQFSKEQSFDIGLAGSSLETSENLINLDISYKDDNLREYSIKKEFSINLIDLTIADRIKIIFGKVRELFS